jgi:hypothetical protein
MGTGRMVRRNVAPQDARLARARRQAGGWGGVGRSSGELAGGCAERNDAAMMQTPGEAQAGHASGGS